MRIESRSVSPGEIRLEASRRRKENPDDVIVWLETERDLEGADRDECFASDDKAKANNHAERCDRLAQAASELAKLRQRVASLTEGLVQKIEVQIQLASRPAWEPTHHHYKGTDYRVLCYVKDANGQELRDAVVYDDAKGNRYTLLRELFEGVLDSGTPRYKAIVREAGLWQIDPRAGTTS